MNSLVKEIRAGNKKEFKNLFDSEYPKLVRLAYGYLFDPMASEDMVQESFIFLWENANRIEIKTSLEGYLYTLVKNRCLNHLKSIDVSRRCNIYEIGMQLEKVEVFEDLDPDNRSCNIWKAVDSLPEKMQRIVIMRFIQNYQYKEIAEELNISVNTVKTQLKRAKIRIEEDLPLISLLGTCFFLL